jgi:hypothetical protein
MFWRERAKKRTIDEMVEKVTEIMGKRIEKQIEDAIEPLRKRIIVLEKLLQLSRIDLDEYGHPWNFFIPNCGRNPNPPKRTRYEIDVCKEMRSYIDPPMTKKDDEFTVTPKKRKYEKRDPKEKAKKSSVSNTKRKAKSKARKTS